MRTVRQLLILLPLLAYGLCVIHLLAPGRSTAGDYHQRLLLCIASAVCGLLVLAVHWCCPPHPKFLLLGKRRVCIRIHVVAGTIEFIAAVVAFLTGDPHFAMATAAVALLAHVPTAAYQAPVVFGSRAIMLPSYLLCIALHGYCAAQLLYAPSSVFWLVQTFLTFSIYAWVRIFYLAFWRWRLFGTWSYSTAVLFAGVLIAPAVLGPLAVLFLVSFIALYVLSYWLVMRPSRDELLDNLMEHRRGTYGSARLRRVWQAFRQQVADGNGSSDELSDMEQARAVFRMLDTDGSGRLDVDEIRKALREAETATKFVDLFVDYLNGKQIDFEFFWRRLWNFGVLRRLSARQPSHPANTSDDQARVVFDQLDLDGSGHIGVFELWILLTEWDLPASDVDECIDKYGDPSGEISLTTFRDCLRPIWRFAYYDVIARPLQEAWGGE